MRKVDKIIVVTIGEVEEEAKIKYAKALARALISEYGKDSCEKLLADLKKLKT